MTVILYSLLSLFITLPLFGIDNVSPTPYSPPPTPPSDDVYSQGLTDEQIRTKDTYFSPQYQQRQLDELCTSNPTVCKGQQVNVIGPMGDMMVQSAAQMLGLFGMMSSSIGQSAVNTGGGAGASGGSHFDWCSMIGMGTEQVAQAHQMFTQQSLMAQGVANNSLPAKDRQLESLYKMKTTYLKREETATIQAGGWGATAGCYTVDTGRQLLTAGTGIGLAQGVTQGAKLAAAVGLAGFYYFKKKKAGESSQFLQSIIDQMKTKGNCNPISELACYCAQPETQNDVQYCLPEAYRKRAQGAGLVTSCVTNQLKPDPQCLCLSNDSCYDAVFKNFPVELGGSASMGDQLNETKQLFRGKFGKGLAESATRQNIGSAKRKLAEWTPPDPDMLTGSQREKSALLEEWGVPKNWSRYLASQPKGQYDDYYADLLRSSGGAAKGTLPTYSSRSAGREIVFDEPNRPQKKTEDSSLSMWQQFNKKKEVAPTALVLDFPSEKAIERGAIHGADRNIFEIISHRYINSTWKKFEVY